MFRDADAGLTPAELADIQAWFDNYCEEHGIIGQSNREYLGMKIFALVNLGFRTPSELDARMAASDTLSAPSPTPQNRCVDES